MFASIVDKWKVEKWPKGSFEKQKRKEKVKSQEMIWRIWRSIKEIGQVMNICRTLDIASFSANPDNSWPPESFVLPLQVSMSFLQVA